MERLASIYDLGLVAETGNTYNRRIALTNKLFTYALAGVPALISDIPAHRDYISQAGISARLFKAGDPNSLASEIDFFLIESRHSFHRYRKYAFLLGQSMLNWEVEQKILLDCVHGSLGL
jgi:hypothetical protein